MILWRWNNETEQWQAHPLQPGQPHSLNAHALFLPLQGERCGLLAQGAVAVNGLCSLPLRLLTDRDEIRVDGEVVYFSTDSPAEAIPVAAQAKELCCGRCKGKLREGETAMQCPRCQAWHHQTDALPCWTYDTRCSSSGCDHPTLGVAWQPELPRRKGT